MMGIKNAQDTGANPRETARRPSTRPKCSKQQSGELSFLGIRLAFRATGHSPEGNRVGFFRETRYCREKNSLVGFENEERTAFG